MNAFTEPLREEPEVTARTYACTFGSYTDTVWTDRRSLSWVELVTILTNHQVGPKDGTCIVPASFTGTRRHKSDAVRIDVVILDSDAGHTLDQIRDSIAEQGWAAIISSTHSHLTTRTKAKRGNWDKFSLSTVDPRLAPTDFLLAKGYLSHVVEGARIAEETAEFVVFEHQPCPKFRIALPLLRPWLAGSYDDQRAANAAWKERIEALAAALRLSHDQACTDTSRLFYLPRRSADGPPPETAMLNGEPCDLFSLPFAEGMQRPTGGQHRGAVGRRRRGTKDTKPEFTDPETGEFIDLKSWARRYASRFEIATALQARRPDVFVPRQGEGAKRHIRCVNEDDHTRVGVDAATFVVNASQGSHGSFVYHCRHAQCDGQDRLRFLRQMLEQDWLLPADLTDPAFLTEETPPSTGRADGPGRQEAWLEIGSDTEIAGRVATDLGRRFGELVQDEGEFWQHNGLHWEAIPAETLWQAVFAYDGALFETPTGELSNVKLGKGRVESILACMQPLLCRRRFFAEAAVGINCASGFITFADGGTLRLVPHSPDHRQRHVLAGHWPRDFSTEVRAASLLNRLLSGCFKDDEDKRHKVDLLAEVAGIAALGMATRIVQPKALVLVGKQAENGKSQILALLRSLLPKAAVSAISPAQFADRTFVCHLAGKLLNAPDELAGTDTIASETFKQVITGEPITARDVYRSAFEFEPRAQHVFATNTLPSFKGGMDRGVRRRLMVLTFTRVIPREERLERIGARIGEQEADLLLDWAVRGASRVIEKQSFTTPASSAEALQDWMYSSDPVLAWLESDEVEYQQNNHIPESKVSVAHDKFIRWAAEEGFGRERLPAVNGFSQRVEAAGKGVTKKRVSDGVRFIGLGCKGAGTGSAFSGRQ
jgi:P4 family phage/plasmid primase-like protien